MFGKTILSSSFFIQTMKLSHISEHPVNELESIFITFTDVAAAGFAIVYPSWFHFCKRGNVLNEIAMTNRFVSKLPQHSAELMVLA